MRTVTDAVAWTIAHAGSEPTLDAASAASGYGADDGPVPEDVPDLGDPGEEDLTGSVSASGHDVGPVVGGSLVEDVVRPDGGRGARPPARPAIVFTCSAARVVHDVPVWLDADGDVNDRLRDIRAQLVALAETLVRVQFAAITAPDLATAHARLVPMTKAELSGALGLEEATGSFASRHRHLFVQVASGLMPLDFFCWAVDPGTEATVLEVAAALDEGLAPAEATRRTAERLGALPNTVGKWTNRVVRLRNATDLVLAARRGWPHDATGDLVSAVFGRGEGEAAVHLALVGRLGPAPAQRAPRPTGGGW